MSAHLKALPVILAAALPIYWLAARAFPEANRRGELRVQAAAVLGCTALAFVSPNLWVYAALLPALLAGLLIGWPARCPRGADGRHRTAQAAVVLWAACLLAVPAVGARLPGFAGISGFLDLHHARLLSLYLLLLLPALVPGGWRDGKQAAAGAAPRQHLHLVDALVLGYAAWQLALAVPAVSLTDLLRQGLGLLLDHLLPYWACSRALLYARRPLALLQSVARAYLITALVLAVLAVFESWRRWPLYDAVAAGWGLHWDLSVFLERAGWLRAKASAGHSLALGAALLLALAAWAGLWRRVRQPALVALSALCLGLGLLASLARGAWLACAVLLVVMLLLGEHGLQRLVRGGLGLGLLAVGAWAVPALRPWLNQVIDLLPFVGTVDAQNIEYRSQLLAMSLQLLSAHPWWGVPGYLAQMEALRQGQGIIDIVNAYLGVALASGLLGLLLFAGPWVLVLKGLLGTLGLPMRRGSGQGLRQEPRGAAAHASTVLVAAGVAWLTLLATTSLVGVLPQLSQSLLGLAAGWLQASAARPAACGVPGPAGPVVARGHWHGMA